MNELIKIEDIQNRIFATRGLQMMFDSDLAKIYGVETKYLNRAVNRNIERFPEKFRFQLTQAEFNEVGISLRSQFATNSENDLRFQNGTSSKHGGRRYLPFAFTEQGVSMLSAVLRSETAIKVSITIIDAFVEMHKFISQNAGFFKRLSNLEQKQLETDIKLLNTDSKIDKVLNALETKDVTPKQNIFFDGQIFDAYTLIADIIRSAKKSIILIDNYIDDTVFKQLAKYSKNVTAIIYSKSTSKIIKQDLQKHNAQYAKIELKKLFTAHDRFLIIDENTMYHFGANLKDAGKKWFACSKLDMEANDIIEKLNPINDEI